LTECKAAYCSRNSASDNSFDKKVSETTETQKRIVNMVCSQISRGNTLLAELGAVKKQS